MKDRAEAGRRAGLPACLAVWMARAGGAWADPADVRSLVEGNSAFAFDLYRHLRAGQGDLVFSPFSLSTALAMPYAGGEWAMLLLLPKQPQGLAALEESLTAAALEKWVSGMRRQQVSVWLPRFRAASEFSLAQALASLGMTDAFSPRTVRGQSRNGCRAKLVSLTRQRQPSRPGSRPG